MRFLGQRVYAFYSIIDIAKLPTNKAKPVYTSTNSTLEWPFPHTPAKLDGIPLDIFFHLSLPFCICKRVHCISSHKDRSVTKLHFFLLAAIFSQIEDASVWLGNRKPSKCWLQQIGVIFSCTKKSGERWLLVEVGPMITDACNVLSDSILFFKNIYLFWSVLGLHCCGRAFSISKKGLLFAVVCRLLFAVASVVVGHGLSCPAVCGIFLDQESDWCPQQVDS